MSQITFLRNKIKSIKTTKKITHAVRLVSMSSYGKLEKNGVFLGDYRKILEEAFIQCVSGNTQWTHPALFPTDILDSRPLVLLISSNKGLCGSFNSNLFRHFERMYFLEEHQEASFIVIGSKAIKFMQENKMGKIICSHNELNYSNFEIIAQGITDLIMDKKNPYSSVWIYSNHFKSFFSQVPEKKQFIPISLEKNLDNIVDFEWEQNQNQILDYLAVRFVKSSILDALFQSILSENASRFLTMDKATNNATEYLEELTLTYNKSRQSLITREVSELAANF